MQEIKESLLTNFNFIDEIKQYLIVFLSFISPYFTLLILNFFNVELTMLNFTILLIFHFILFCLLQINLQFVLSSLDIKSFTKFVFIKFIKFSLTSIIFIAFSLTFLEGLGPLGDVYEQGGLSQDFSALLFKSLAVAVPTIFLTFVLFNAFFYAASLIELYVIQEKKLSNILKIRFKDFFKGYLMNMLFNFLLLLLFLFILFSSGSYLSLILLLTLSVVVAFTFNFNFTHLDL